MREIGFTYDDTMFKCGNFADKIGTVAMNEVIYNGAKRGWYDQAGIPRRLYSI